MEFKVPEQYDDYSLEKFFKMLNYRKIASTEYV